MMAKNYTIDINGVEITFRKRQHEKTVCIDRVFIPYELRGKKLLLPALKKIVEAADRQQIRLDTTIFPDIQHDKIYEHLRQCFGAVGFLPERFDGEVYRNDLVREPKTNQ